MEIQITNHGPLITASNYWESELAEAGKFFVSVNAGAIRILMPPSHYHELEEMSTAKYCVVSRGPWHETTVGPDGHVTIDDHADAVEILFEDDSDSPYMMKLTWESFDAMPGAPLPAHEWVLSVWTELEGCLYKELERICYWRRVPLLPWGKPWRDGKC